MISRYLGALMSRRRRIARRLPKDVPPWRRRRRIVVRCIVHHHIDKDGRVLRSRLLAPRTIVATYIVVTLLLARIRRIIIFGEGPHVVEAGRAPSPWTTVAGLAIVSFGG